MVRPVVRTNRVRRDDATNVHVCGSGMSAARRSLRCAFARLARTARTIEFADGARLLVDDRWTNGSE
jgi:hypothetical protein